MSLWSYKKPIAYFNKVVLTPIADAAGWRVNSAAAGGRRKEILVAIKGLATKNAVAYPTFAAVQPATVHYTTGQTFTFQVNASSAVAVSGLPTVALTIGAFTRQAVYNAATSTTTALKFDYTFVAGDVAASSVPIAAVIVSQSGYSITMPIDAVSSEKIPDASLVYSAIAVSGVTIN